MADKFFKKTGKILFLLIVTHIVAIFVISSLPVFYETISAEDHEFWVVSPPLAKKAVMDNPSNQSILKSRIHYNFYTMQKRDNINIQEVSEEYKMINYLLWGGLIVSIVAFIGLILHSTEQFPKESIILLGIGFSIIFLTAFCVYKQFQFIDTINGFSDINFSAIWKPDSNLYYIYLMVLLGLISFFGSVVYVGRVSFRLFNQRREILKKQSLEKIVSKNEDIEKKSDDISDGIGKPFFGESFGGKNEDIEKNMSKSPRSDKKTDLEKGYEEEVKAKEDDKKKVEIESFFNDEKNEKKDVVEDKKKDSDEKKVEIESFVGQENEDRGKSVKEESKSGKEDVENTEVASEPSDYVEEESVSFKEVKIRCPKCKHVFKVKKKINGVTHMYCPQCGQKGVLK